MDMVFFVPRERVPLRLWLRTDAERPEVAIDDEVFLPRATYDGPPRWIDLGVTEKLGGFGQLRVRGMSPVEAEESYLVVTARVDEVLSGSLVKPDLGEAGREVLSSERRTARGATRRTWCKKSPCPP